MVQIASCSAIWLSSGTGQSPLSRYFDDRLRSRRGHYAQSRCRIVYRKHRAGKSAYICVWIHRQKNGDSAGISRQNQTGGFLCNNIRNQFDKRTVVIVTTVVGSISFVSEQLLAVFQDPDDDTSTTRMKNKAEAKLRYAMPCCHIPEIYWRDIRKKIPERLTYGWRSLVGYLTRVLIIFYVECIRKIWGRTWGRTWGRPLQKERLFVINVEHNANKNAWENNEE